MMRTLLFAPGSDETKIQKALRLKPDAVILDLEDAVALSEKAKARQLVTELLRQSSRKRVFVRINSLATSYALADIRQVVEAQPFGIMLPKAESKQDIYIVDWVLSQLEQEYGIPLGQTDLIPLVESAAGVENCLEIVSASARVKQLAFGALDYTADLGTSYSKTGEETLYARSRLVAASRAVRKEGPIDTVFPDVKDTEGLKQETLLVKQLGFRGKLVIHPGQIEPVHQVFNPTETEVKKSKRIVTAFEEARSNGQGVFQLDGKMIDTPVLKRAQQILEMVNLNQS